MTAAHLDYEALADFAEGILDDATATSTQEHLAHCDDCRRRAADVAEVSRVLARAPMPPMPAHLVDRLDAALAAEAASHSPEHRHHRRFQFVAAAAAAAVLVGGGAAAVRTVMDDGDSSSVTGTQPPMADRTASTAPAPLAAPQVPFTLVRTGTKYTSAALDSQVTGAMSKSTVGGNHAMSAASDILGACVARVDGGKPPLLVDAATYEGRTATVIALPGSDTAHADVWVVGDRCSASDSDVLVHRQVAR
ncbi:MAG TPA: zf-HC2 domain-containing protein [Actinoallomurus sp.]